MAQPRSLLGGSNGEGKRRRPRSLLSGAATTRGRAQPKKDDDGGGGGGFFGLVKETAGIVKGAPGGALQLSKDAVKDTYHGYKATRDALGMAGEGVVTGDTEKIKRGVVDYAMNATPLVPISQEQALAYGRGLLGGGDVPEEQHPLFSGFGQSMHRTAGRVTHPGRYKEAYEEGHLVGAVVEDAGNVALIAGVGSKALNAAGKGSLAEAQGARAAAAAAEKSIPKLSKAVAKAEARVADDQALILQEGGTTGPTVQHFTQAADSAGVLGRARAALTDAERIAAQETARADALLASTPKTLTRAHRLASAVERLGTKGANAPIAPFTMSGKVLGKGVRELIRVTPGLEATLGQYLDNVVLGRANKRDLDHIKDPAVAEGESLSHAYAEAGGRMWDLLEHNEDLYHATMLDLAGVTPLLADGIVRLQRTAPELAATVLDELAKAPEMEGTVGALELAIKIARGEVDEARMARVREAQAQYRGHIERRLTERYKAGRGTSRVLSDEGLEQRRWNAEDATVNPMERRRLEERQAADRLQLEEEVTRRTEHAAEVERKITIDPERMKDAPGLVAHNVEAAWTQAERLVTAARGNPKIMAELRALTRLGDDAPLEVLTREVAAAIEKAAGSERLQRRFPVLGQAVRTGQLHPIRLRGLDSPSFRPVERAAAAAGKAEASAAHARRLRATAERLKGAGEEVVDRVVRASERVLKARERAAAAREAAEAARREIAASASLPEGGLPDHMVDSVEYRLRGETAEGQLVDTRPSHAQVVADAMEAREAVPPWVIEEYLPVPVPKKPGPLARGVVAERQLKAHNRAMRINAERAANPEQARIVAMQSRATRAWKRSAAGKAYNQALNNVESMRKGVVSSARAELDAVEAFGALPDKIAFMPGKVSEFYDGLIDDAGGPEWSIVDDAEALRARRGAANLPDEDLWVRAYNQRWERLPQVVKESFERLSENAVRTLYRKWRMEGLDPEALGLDEMVGTFAPDVERNLAMSQFREAFGRRAALRRIVNSGERGGFFDTDLRRFFGSTMDAEMLALADDDVAMASLARGSRAEAARVLYEGDLTRAQGIELPDTATWRRLWREEPSGTMEVPEDVVHEAFGSDYDGAGEFLYEWEQAGRPDLEQVIDDLADGVKPEWLQGANRRAGEAAVAKAERRAAAARRMDEADEAMRYPEPGQRPGTSKLTPPERALAGEQVAQRRVLNPEGDLARLLEREGGQGRVESLATRAEADADRAAARAAATDADAARAGAVGKIAQQASDAFVKHGKELERYRVALRELKFSERRLKNLPLRQARELKRFMADLRQAPARYRAPLIVSRKAGEVVSEIETDLRAALGEGEKLDPVIEGALGEFQADLVRTLADITREGHGKLLPDGSIERLPPLIDPVYVPAKHLPDLGNDAGTGTVSGDRVAIRKASSEQFRRSGQVPRTPTEMQTILTRRVQTEVMNEVARQAEAAFGVRPGMILGPERAQQLAEDSETNPGEARATIIREMREQGYEPWNPRKLIPSDDNPRGLGTVVLTDPAELTTSTLFLPKGMVQHFEDQFRGAGPVERFMRKAYDKPTNVWKASVLALSPRWHLNNMVGNFIMATFGGGVSPMAWTRGMRDAHALLRREGAEFRSANAELLGLTERQTARATRTLGRAEARIAKIDPGALQALEGPSGIEIDPRIPQRGAGSAALDPYTSENVGTMKGPAGALQRGVRRSYEFNGFVDDLNRVAVFLEKYKKMTTKDLAEFAAQHPSLASLTGDLQTLRKEAAVRMSLDALGNFRKMSRFERQFVRRAVPFYAWMRHITKLALRLPVTAPLRVVWMLHLADLYGEPPEYGFLSGTIPLGGDRFLRLPRGNPFEDVVALPSTGSPTQAALTATGSVGPIPRLALAAGLGIDSRTMQQVTRPPGSGNLDEYGREGITPLAGDPFALARFGLNMTPQGRIAQVGVDEVKYGSPRLRYGTGDVVRTGSGATIDSGRSIEGELSSLVGLPYQTTADLARLREVEAERRAAQERARQRYRRRPAPSGGTRSGSTSLLR